MGFNTNIANCVDKTTVLLTNVKEYLERKQFPRRWPKPWNQPMTANEKSFIYKKCRNEMSAEEIETWKKDRILPTAVREELENVFFTPVPGMPNITINRKGTPYSLKSKKRYSVSLAKRGYYVSRITPEIDRVRGDVLIQVHVLLALAYIPIPDWLREFPLEKWRVNHKNRIKTDIALDNLEWCTNQQNCDHAYKNGLRPDATVICVRRARKGSKVQEFYSMAECGRYFGVGASAVHTALNKTKLDQYKGHYVWYKDLRSTTNNSSARSKM